MRHLDVAQLYLKLCHASDTTYLLREAVGHLSTFIVRHERSLSAKHVQTIVLCKAIFDSQRIYLSTRDPDPRKVLDLDCLLDAITCLLAVRNEINKPQNRDVNQDGQYLLRQAFVSGLRALLLRHVVRQRTLDSLAEWTRSWDAYDDVDEMIVRPLLDEANQPGRNGRRVAGLTLAEADARGPAMFFLDNWNSLRQQLNQCIADPHISIAQAFWLCYDARLALFHASYHFLQQTNNSDVADHSVDAVDQPGMLALVQQCAQSFDGILHRSSQSGSRPFLAKMLEKLEPTPHCHGCRAECSCFLPTNNHDIDECDQSLLYSSIRRLNDYLSGRALATFNGSHELVNLAKMSERWNDEWLVKQNTNLEEHRYEMHGLENTSRMHCVSGETLFHWMHDMRLLVSADKLFTGEPLFVVNVNCSSCLAEKGISASASLARKVTPLSQISDDFTELQRKWELWQPEREVDTPPDPTVIQSPVSSSRPFGSSHAGPSRKTSSESGSPRRRDSSTEAANTQEATSSSNPSSGLLRIFRRDSSNPSKSAIDLSEVEFHSLTTADGHYVIVWYKSKLAIFVRHKQHWMTPLSLDGDIHVICASCRVLCITVKTAEGCKLLIYSLPEGKRIPQEVHIPDQVHCMALSLDSRALIIGTSQNTYRILFSISQKSIVGFLVHRKPVTPPKDCPPNTSVDSQTVSFSPNGHRAVLATRFKPNGQIKCVIYDMAEREELVSKGAIKLHDPLKFIGARDFGLTAVPCHYDKDAQVTTFLVCCSADNGKQTLYTFDESSRKPKQMDIIYSSKGGDPGPSIHKAISLLSTQSFVLLNELGHMWVLQKPDISGNWSCKRHVLNKAPQRSSHNRRPRTHLSGSESREVQICCVEKGKAKLFLCQMGVQTDTRVEEIDLYPFLSSQ